MSDSLSIERLKAIFAELARVMAENFQLLTDLDAVAGDGDLGITTSKGFAAANKAAHEYADKDAGRLLLLAGMAIAREAPSTLGTLLASGFMKGAKEVMGMESLPLPATVRMMDGFVRGIMERGKAQQGDKTIIDALFPAVEALRAAEPNSSLAEAWAAALSAAEAGLQNTKQMRAVHGRAAYRGESSIGMVDPGATVGVLLVRVFAEGVR
jgi:dihydroxyacetone kinase-like protein